MFKDPRKLFYVSYFTRARMDCLRWSSDGTHGGLAHILAKFARKVARCCSYSMLASIFSHCCSNARTVPLVWPTFLSLASSRLLYFVVRLSDCSRMYRGGERPSWIRESVLRLEVAIESHRNYNHVQRQQTVEKVRCSKLSL